MVTSGSMFYKRAEQIESYSHFEVTGNVKTTSIENESMNIHSVAVHLG